MGESNKSRKNRKHKSQNAYVSLSQVGQVKATRQVIGSFDHSSGAGTSGNIVKNLSSIDNAR